MSLVAPTARQVFEGNPPSPSHQLSLSLAARWGTNVEAMAATGGISWFDETLFDLQNRPGTSNGQYAAVMSGADKGIYEKQGGVWVQVASLPTVLTESASADAAAASATQAATSATNAATSATAAAASATNAGNSASAAALAAANAGAPAFVDTTAGLAGTTEGDLFRVYEDGVTKIYLHAAGPTATLQTTLNDAGALQVRFDSKALAEAYTQHTTAPETLTLTGFSSVANLGRGIVYKKVGSEPWHGGKLELTLSGGGSQWYEVSADQALTPAMFGGGETGIFQAMQHANSGAVKHVDLGNWVEYDMALTNTITTTKLRVTGHGVTFTCSTRTVGMQGVMFWFQHADDLRWECDCALFLANKYSGGIVGTAEGATSEIRVRGIKVWNPNYNSAGSTAGDLLSDRTTYAATGAHWQACGLGFEGFHQNASEADAPFELTNANTYAYLEIEDCQVYNVIRATQAAFSTGIYAQNGAKMRIIRPRVTGVYLGDTANAAVSGWNDAVGIVCYSDRLLSGLASNRAAYAAADVVIEDALIENIQGVGVKTKLGSPAQIIRPVFRFNTTTTGGEFHLINDQAAACIDDQEVPSQITDAKLHLEVTIQHDNGFFFCMQRTGVGDTAPLDSAGLTRTHRGGFDGLDVYYKSTAAADHRLTSLVYLDLATMVASGHGRYFDFEYNRPRTMSDQGYTGGRVAGHWVAGSVWYPNIAAFTSLNAQIGVSIDHAKVIAPAFTDTSSWGTGGEHTNYFQLQFTNNVLHAGTGVNILPYTSGDIFTDDVFIKNNAIGSDDADWNPGWPTQS